MESLSYTYVNIHWLSLDGKSGRMVGMFSRPYLQTLSLISIMRESVGRLESNGIKVANVTIESFFEVNQEVAELYMMEKDSFEEERNAIAKEYFNREKDL